MSIRPRARAASRPDRTLWIQIVATPSGGGRTLEIASRLQAALSSRGHRVHFQFFDRLDDLERWTSAEMDPLAVLICVGGDGTLDTAAASALERPVRFVPVPSGFGNLFGRALRLPNRVDRVVDLVEKGEAVPVDVGVRNGKTFLCHESFGLLADIQQRGEVGERLGRARWQRRLGYYLAALRHAYETALPGFQVTVDGRVVARDAVIVTVANVETYGPTLMLTPGASPADGLFDVFVMERASKREVLTRLLAWHLRLSSARRGTYVVQGRRVTVLGDGGRREELEMRPGALQVVVTPDVAQALVRERQHAEGTRRVA